MISIVQRQLGRSSLTTLLDELLPPSLTLGTSNHLLNLAPVGFQSLVRVLLCLREEVDLLCRCPGRVNGSELDGGGGSGRFTTESLLLLLVRARLSRRSETVGLGSVRLFERSDRTGPTLLRVQDAEGKTRLEVLDAA